MICVVSDARLCDVVCFTVGRRCYHKMVDDILGSSEVQSLWFCGSLNMACSTSFSFISKCDRAYETEHMNAISTQKCPWIFGLNWTKWSAQENCTCSIHGT